MNFDALQFHLQHWMTLADKRVHGTTHKQPGVVFEREEKQALSPLPLRPTSARNRRIRRKVANDSLVNVDTIRYSVPHRYVGEVVEVQIGESHVGIYLGKEQIAKHVRSQEPHSKVSAPQHYDGLLRAQMKKYALREEEIDQETTAAPHDKTLRSMGRSLGDYDEILGGPL